MAAYNPNDAILILEEHGESFTEAGTSGEYMMLCVWHDESTPSLSVNPLAGEWGLYNCFGCDAKGTVAQLVGFLTRGLDARGVRAETQSHFRIEVDQNKHAWAYPVVMDGKEVRHRYKAWSSSEGQKYWWGPAQTDAPTRASHLLYHGDSITPGSTEAHLFEGEPDVWVAYQAGISGAVSMLAGAGSVSDRALQTLADKGIQRLFIYYDNDDAGYGGANQVARVCRGLGIEPIIKVLPDRLGKGGDVGDLYKELKFDDVSFRQALADLPIRQPEVEAEAEVSSEPEMSSRYDERLTTEEEDALIAGTIPFVSDYMWAALQQVKTHPERHAAMALVLLSQAVGRHFVPFDLMDAPYSNLYVLIVGKSTTAKSPTLALMARVAAQAFGEKEQLPASFSPEALLKAFSEHKDSTGLLVVDEFAVPLRGIKKQGGYMQDTAQYLMLSYDGIETLTRATTKGTYEIKAFSLNLVGAMTPAVFEELTHEDDIRSGLLGRFLIVASDDGPEPEPLGRTIPGTMLLQAEMALFLRRVREKFMASIIFEGKEEKGVPHFAKFTDAALARYMTYQTDLNALAGSEEVIQAVYNRLKTLLVKVSMLMAAVRVTQDDEDISPGLVIVEEMDVIRALFLIEMFRPAMSRQLSRVGKGHTERLMDDIVGFLSQRGGKASRRDISRRFSSRCGTSQRMDSIRDTMLDRGLVIVQEDRPEDYHKGKKPETWRLPRAA